MTEIASNHGISEKTAVALGLFDGVHLGHRKVVEYAIRFSENGYIPAVFTFKNFTVNKKQGRKLEYIYTDCQKELILRNMGIKMYCSENFSLLKVLSGEEFVSEILLKRLNAGQVICGRDFRFGKNAACGTEELERFGEKYGFGVVIAPDVKSDGEKISSKRIRELLENGRVDAAGRLLGGCYHINSTVAGGRKLGRTLKFPTINQNFEEGQLVPKRGVYHTLTSIDGRKYASITNVGVKPTVEDNIQPLAETHILDFSGDLYGQTIRVEFCGYLREETKFASVEELKKQVHADIARVRSMSLGKGLA